MNPQFLSRGKSSRKASAVSLTPGTTGDVSSPSGSAKTRILPSLEDFARQRDFTGLIAFIDHQKNTGKENIWTELWSGYAYFHLGNFEEALKVYQKVLNENSLNSSAASGPEKSRKQSITNLFRSKKQSSEEKKDSAAPESTPVPDITPDDVLLYMTCCQFYLGFYEEAQGTLSKVSASCKSALKRRLELHLKFKSSSDMKITDDLLPNPADVQDQLCLASLDFLKGKYQEAIDIYKKILVDKRDCLAINVYIALCYYKMDYYDVSQEILTPYIKAFPDSCLAVNLKACNHYRLYNGKAAEGELRTLIDVSSSGCSFGKELLRHNLVVFRSGENALSVFPSLMDILPEARFNLVIHYLRYNDPVKAFELMKEINPESTNEHILKAVVMAIIGQDSQTSSQVDMTPRDLLSQAQKHFQVVGSSPSECDTIPGRQCMSSYFFLTKQFDDVILYLSSIKSYFYNDDSFNFNYGQAKAATGKYSEAREIFLQIQDPILTQDILYLSWLTRCHVMTKNVSDAWSLFRSVSSSSLAFQILTLLANDCYRMGMFLESLKGFDLLDRLDSSPEYWEAKRGAAVGHFQAVIGGKEHRDSLQEVMSILRGNKNPQAEQICNVIRKWISTSR